MNQFCVKIDQFSITVSQLINDRNSLSTVSLIEEPKSNSVGSGLIHFNSLQHFEISKSMFTKPKVEEGGGVCVWVLGVGDWGEDKELGGE